MINNKKIFVGGSLMVLCSIVIGAFAAHQLKKILPPENLSSIKTGADYLMYSGLGLLIVSFVNQKITKAPARLIAIGAILFSGSIFLLTCLIFNKVNFPKIIGLITPLGGLSMILGWLLLAANVLRKK